MTSREFDSMTQSQRLAYWAWAVKQIAVRVKEKAAKRTTA